MTKWIHIIYLSIIAVLSYLLWQQPDKTVTVTTEKVIANQPKPQHKIERSITIESEEHTDVLIAEGAASTEQQTQTEKQIRTEEISLHYTNAEIAELLAKTINVEKVKERMQTEAIDQGWAYAMQENLKLLYDKNESLHRATLNNIECRTTVCEVQFTNTEAPIDFMSNFHQKMVQSQWYNGNYQSVMTSDSETQTQTFYIVRTN